MRPNKDKSIIPRLVQFDSSSDFVKITLLGGGQVLRKIFNCHNMYMYTHSSILSIAPILKLIKDLKLENK